MKRSLIGALAIGLSTALAMSVALDDASVGIALGAAAFIAFGGFSAKCGK